MVKEMKPKVPSKRYMNFYLSGPAKFDPKNFASTEEQKIKNAGGIQEFCKTKGRKIYPSMCVNKAAFAERTKRSLKSLRYPLREILWDHVHN